MGAPLTPPPAGVAATTDGAVVAVTMGAAAGDGVGVANLGLAVGGVASCASRTGVAASMACGMGGGVAGSGDRGDTTGSGEDWSGEDCT